ncbi:unnamed protein product [Paramecium sonneborni]|uniref:Uncharacterized protein n=1 Tax=Paramecium sonneborni TaxID=65129 RepID=A0A8S1RDZ4_9CILI|nr:unnamed protein product [Paramecium sonneborni]
MLININICFKTRNASYDVKIKQHQQEIEILGLLRLQRQRIC